MTSFSLMEEIQLRSSHAEEEAMIRIIEKVYTKEDIVKIANRLIDRLNKHQRQRWSSHPENCPQTSPCPYPSRDDMEGEKKAVVPFTRPLLSQEQQMGPLLETLSRSGEGKLNVTPAVLDRGRSTIQFAPKGPDLDAEFLDITQQLAVKHGLAKDLTIIHGPRGTRKIFLGLLLVKLLLVNLNSSPSRHSDPVQNLYCNSLSVRTEEVDSRKQGLILVLCHTNDALHQFVQDIDSLENWTQISIGGTNSSARDSGPHFSLRQHEESMMVEGIHSRRRRHAWQKKSDPEFESRRDYTRIMIKSLEMVHPLQLRDVATPQQFNSLFLPMASPAQYQMILRLWLIGETAAIVYRALHFWGPSVESLDVSEASHCRYLGTQQREKIGSSQHNERGHAIPGRNMHDMDPDEHCREAVPDIAQANRVSHDPNVWHLNVQQRKTLFEYWMHLQTQQRLERLEHKYSKACKRVSQKQKFIQLSLLRMTKVLGISTPAAAKYNEILEELDSEIVHNGRKR